MMLPKLVVDLRTFAWGNCLIDRSRAEYAAAIMRSAQMSLQLVMTVKFTEAGFAYGASNPLSFMGYDSMCTEEMCSFSCL